MADSSFTYMATVTASTKRGNMTTGFQANLSGLKCFPLAPVDPETRKRLELNTPHIVYETFFQGDLDIKKGDLLVINSVEFPVRSVAVWPWQMTDTRLHVVVEDLRS